MQYAYDRLIIFVMPRDCLDYDILKIEDFGLLWCDCVYDYKNLELYMLSVLINSALVERT